MIGIDLGTTNSLVAVMEGGHPRVLANELNEKLTPSVVATAEDGTLLVGRAAKDRVVVEPDAGVACFKRDMGLEKKYRFGGQTWTPAECSAVILREMKRIAQNHLGREIDQAVITVPAYFRDEQRQATMEAAEIAELKVCRLINEPTAAALAYGYRASDEEKNLFIFDLGGGTFDVTLLEIFDGIIEVKASGGVSRLGGEDYTDALVDYIIEKANDSPSAENRLRWRQEIETIKRRLTETDSTTVSLNGNTIDINRDDFEKASRELTARVRPVLQRCLRDAGMSADSIDDVLLVGGATRMPLVVKTATEELNRIPNQKLDPDQAVALGAAVQSALLDGDTAVEDIVLTDVCSHTLGVEVSHQVGPGRFDDGYFSPLIDRNTTVPVSRSHIYSTLHPQQTQINLRIYQGEGRKVQDNHKIGEVVVRDVKGASGDFNSGQVDVRFTYDMNGILEVEATPLVTGKTVTKVFEEKPGTMSKKEIAAAIKKLQPLKTHPRDQMVNRARLERANRLFEELVGSERDQLSMIASRFETALETQDQEEIDGAGEFLDRFMEPFFTPKGLSLESFD